MKALRIFQLFSIVTFFGLTGTAQKNNAEDIKRIVESRKYIFKAQVAYPATGQSRQLTSDYDLSVSPNAVTSYLPYFGEAYIAPIDPTDGGLKFTSTSFEYNAIKKEKNWEIMIRPKDARDVQQFNLTIFDNGNANLDVTNARRQSISYSGYIR
jgi:Domain of unknown function (DUF4251)